MSDREEEKVQGVPPLEEMKEVSLDGEDAAYAARL